MSVPYRLELEDLLSVLETWDEKLRHKVFIAACGGTALTLYGHKESTKDVDFLIPDPRHHGVLLKLISALGYTRATGFGFKHPTKPWIFDLFAGQTIFETALLDPVTDRGKHHVVKKYKRITLACINPDDLIISKMFRGTMVDVQDSITIITAEKLDLTALAQRYKDTAEYYVNPAKCKANLQYLIQDMEREGIDASALKEMSEQWNP